MLESMDRHLALRPCKVYDPWIKDDIVPNQVHSMEEFLEGLDMIVVMVGHSHLEDYVRQIEDLVVFDTCDVCGVGAKVYKL